MDAGVLVPLGLGLMLALGVNLMLLGLQQTGLVLPLHRKLTDALQAENLARKQSIEDNCDRLRRRIDVLSVQREAISAQLVRAGDNHTHLVQRFEAHGPHVREHDCRFELSSVEADGLEHVYRCTVEHTCKTRLIFKAQGVMGHLAALLEKT